MPTITIIHPDETVEVIQCANVAECLVDNVPGIPLRIFDWNLYGDRPCQVFVGFNAEDINLGASALYLLAWGIIYLTPETCWGSYLLTGRIVPWFKRR